MGPLSKDGLGCSYSSAFLQLAVFALCRPISLVWLGIGTLNHIYILMFRRVGSKNPEEGELRPSLEAVRPCNACRYMQKCTAISPTVMLSIPLCSSSH